MTQPFRLALACLFAVLLVAVPRTGAAQDEPAFTPDETVALETLVRRILTENPDIVIDAIQAFQARQEQEEADRRRELLAEVGDALENDPFSPIGGNPDGDVTLVEFSDYNCGYCKRMVGPIQQLIQSDGNLKVVFKELPILAPSSRLAAEAALAARMQGLYVPFHVALMQHRGELTEPVIFGLAERVGLDVARLRVDMQAPEVEQEIQNNLELAQLVGVRGTPAFVLDGALIPGAVPIDQLRQSIASVRERAGG